jgi:hypothetical protein
MKSSHKAEEYNTQGVNLTQTYIIMKAFINIKSNMHKAIKSNLQVNIISEREDDHLDGHQLNTDTTLNKLNVL